MQTLWFPTPVLILLRRVANVVSSLSISHQYLRSRIQLEGAAESSVENKEDRPTLKLWDTFRSIRWSLWINTERDLSSVPILASTDSGIDQTPQETNRRPNVNDLPPKPPNRDVIHSLLNSPVLYDPLRTPRYPIALCHGLYGFDVRGPSAFPILQKHYWSNVLSILRDKVGAEVIVTSVPGTGSIASRAESMDRYLREKALGRGINFMAHSMGGLDCRHLISHIRPTDYTPLSLTTIATPHRGSPFMDWCRENIGIGRLRQKEEAMSARRAIMEDNSPDSGFSRPPQHVGQKAPSLKSTMSLASLPSSFTTLLLSLLDSPAYANLTSAYLATMFNPSTPDHPHVKYFSIAGRIANLNIWHPLWLPKMVLDGFEERERERLRKEGDPLWAQSEEWGNDALVTIQSARWGEFLGVLEGCDHWELRGARGIEVDLPSVSVPGLNIALGGSSSKEDRQKQESEGWNLADWGRFVRTWRREEKKAAKTAGAEVSERKYEERKAHKTGHADASNVHADEVLKSSTDKLSAVFDWIVEQVPSSRSLSPVLSPSSGSPADTSGGESGKASEVAREEREKKQTERSDLATKADLERFYVALCRKLYDEGL